jgi:hypothetical protein
MKQAMSTMAALGLTLISALVFILISVLFFVFNVWIVDVSATLVGFDDLSADWAVLTAGILSAASILSAALR